MMKFKLVNNKVTDEREEALSNKVGAECFYIMIAGTMACLFYGSLFNKGVISANYLLYPLLIAWIWSIVHPGHLYPHHQRNAEGRGGEDRRLYGNSYCQAGTRAARPAGGKPVQGDPVREGGVKAAVQNRAILVSASPCFLVRIGTQPKSCRLPQSEPSSSNTQTISSIR